MPTIASAITFVQDLQWRGLIQQSTSPNLASFLSTPQTLYCGFDPTADSLHVGSLLPLITLLRFKLAGHTAIGLLGGATGLIGDPSGRSSERNLQTPETVQKNLDSIKQQITPFTSLCLNNIAWTQQLSLLDFLRDTGKCFSVNAMLQRDSVKSRLDREGDGLSFTEFTYMLLQAHDFLHLHQHHQCCLQIGGSDQWGNMCSGTDLIRRKTTHEAHAITLPLLTRPDGQKFGKTAEGAIWLSPLKTNPWHFYQFWLNTDDTSAIPLLKQLTLLDRPTIETLEELTLNSPHLRSAQQQLAFSLTSLVHGTEIATNLAQATSVLFTTQSTFQFHDLPLATINTLKHALPTAVYTPNTSLVDILVALKIEPSRSAATRSITSNAIRVNGSPISNPLWQPNATSWHHNTLLVRKGKKTLALLQQTSP